MNILGEKVFLRAIEREDLGRLHRWSNDPDVQRSLGGWHFPLSIAAIERWSESFRHDDVDQRFVIDVHGVGPVGLVTLTKINWKDRNAFHGILIGEATQRRKGYAVDAVRAVMRYAFAELGLERLDTTIVEFNSASLRLHTERCGWTEEGRKLNAVYRGGKFCSLVILGVTREHYLENSKAMQGTSKRSRRANS